jgi:quercetin dioxygenase-like cupin family protein
MEPVDMFEQVRVDKEKATLIDRDDFVGVVRRQEIVLASDEHGVEVLAVFFEAGARTRPHLHEVDQILHVVEGEGALATETSLQIIKPGDVMRVPRGVWHWHGATPGSSMCHLSIKVLGATDWKQPERNWADYMDVAPAGGGSSAAGGTTAVPQ